MSSPSKGNKPITADDGATMAEYALLIALIAIVVIVTTATLGQTISAFFINFAAMLP